MPNPVDCVGRRVHLNALTSCFENGSEYDQEKHEEETFHTAPDVHELRNEEVASPACDCSNNADYGCKAVLLKSRGDVWVQVRLNSR